MIDGIDSFRVWADKDRRRTIFRKVRYIDGLKFGIEIASDWIEMDMSRDCREHVHAIVSQMDRELRPAITQAETSNVG